MSLILRMGFVFDPEDVRLGITTHVCEVCMSVTLNLLVFDFTVGFARPRRIDE